MNDKPRTSLSRRTLLQGTATAAAAASVFNINHAWSKDVVWDGKPFDANDRFTGGLYILKYTGSVPAD